MTDLKVSKTHMLALLGKLARDHGFRAKFETNPEGALADVGISKDQIRGFPVDHKSPGKLATPAEFEKAFQEMSQKAENDCLCMVGPGLRLNDDPATKD